MYKKLGIIIIVCICAITITMPIYNKERKKIIKRNIYDLQYKYKNNYDEGIKNAESEINDKSNSEYENSIYSLLRLHYYYQKQEYNKVIEISKGVEEKLIKNNLKEELLFFYAMMINIYNNLEDYTQVYTYIYKCEKMTYKFFNEFKDQENSGYLITTRYFRANIIFKLGLEDEAKRIFNEAEDLRSKYKGKEIADMNYNILLYYSNINDHDLIEEYADKTLELIKDKKYYTSMYIDVNVILAESYLKSNNIDKCLEILKELDEDKNVIFYKDKYKLYILYGLVFEYYGKNDEKIKYLEMAYNEIKNTTMHKLKFFITEELIETYEKMGNKNKVDEKSIVYKSLSNELINSLDTPYLIRKIIDTDLQYANYQIESLEFEKNKLIYYINLCMLFVLSMIILSLQKNKNKKILEQNISILNRQMKYQHKYYQNIKQNQLETRWIWHDMKNHINVIDNLIKKKEFNKVKNYINEVDDKISRLDHVTICNNSIIDAILSNKIQACENKGIYIDYNIKIPSKLGIDDFDLSVIFGNLLDNAIEACENIKDNEIKKQIIIKSIIQGEYLYISIKNSKNTEVKFNGSKLISLKKDKIFHGIGFENIKRSVQKYDGDIKIDYSQNDFTVKILIKHIT